VDIIDRYAYSNRIRHVWPDHKVGVALAVLVLCLALNELLVGLAAVGWMFLLAVAMARVPARTFGRVLLAEGSFMVLTTLGILLSVSTGDPRGLTVWTWKVGPLWVSSSPASLRQGAELVARALGCATAMNFLALTTPLVDIVEMLRRWRVPVVLIDIMTITYRSIFVLLDSANTMYVAQDSRLGYHGSRLRAIRNAALLASRLFMDAYQRGMRLQVALESRGFDGELRVLPATYRTDRRVLAASAVASLSLVLVWLAL
jgi:cobalt/nickel transport system permease protein